MIGQWRISSGKKKMSRKPFTYNANGVCTTVIPEGEFHNQDLSNCHYLLDVSQKTADHLSAVIIDLAIVNLTRLHTISQR